MELTNKTVLIDIEVADVQLNYNIILGHSYMYSIKEIDLTIFHLMMFLHEWKILTTNHLT